MRTVRAKESPPEIQIFTWFCVFCSFSFVCLFVFPANCVLLINLCSNVFDLVNVLSIVLIRDVTASLGMMPYPVMFYLQGRRGSAGQQGLAGTPGAAVRIETDKNQIQWNAINIQY